MIDKILNSRITVALVMLLVFWILMILAVFVVVAVSYMTKSFLAQSPILFVINVMAFGVLAWNASGRMDGNERP